MAFPPATATRVGDGADDVIHCDDATSGDKLQDGEEVGACGLVAVAPVDENEVEGLFRVGGKPSREGFKGVAFDKLKAVAVVVNKLADDVLGVGFVEKIKGGDARGGRGVKEKLGRVSGVEPDFEDAGFPGGKLDKDLALVVELPAMPLADSKICAVDVHIVITFNNSKSSLYKFSTNS